MMFTPRSRHRSIWRRASFRSDAPTLANTPCPPNVIVPSVRVETRSPDVPSWRYSMGPRRIARGALRRVSAQLRTRNVPPLSAPAAGLGPAISGIEGPVRHGGAAELRTPQVGGGQVGAGEDRASEVGVED